MSDLTDQELDDLIAVGRESLNKLLAVRKARRDEAFEEAIKSNPWKVGEEVTTKFSYRNYKIVRLMPSSVVVIGALGGTLEERIPLRRVLPADPAKDHRKRGQRG